jgi:hypothetical protein
MRHRASTAWLAPIFHRFADLYAKSGERLDLLQRVLPFAIVISVLVYETLTEFVLNDFIPDWIHFALNNFIFGILVPL